MSSEYQGDCKVGFGDRIGRSSVIELPLERRFKPLDDSPVCNRRNTSGSPAFVVTPSAPPHHPLAQQIGYNWLLIRVSN